MFSVQQITHDNHFYGWFLMAYLIDLVRLPMAAWKILCMLAYDSIYALQEQTFILVLAIWLCSCLWEILSSLFQPLNLSLLLHVHGWWFQYQEAANGKFHTNLYWLCCWRWTREIPKWVVCTKRVCKLHLELKKVIFLGHVQSH